MSKGFCEIHKTINTTIVRSLFFKESTTVPIKLERKSAISIRSRMQQPKISTNSDPKIGMGALLLRDNILAMLRLLSGQLEDLCGEDCLHAAAEGQLTRYHFWCHVPPP